MSYIDEREESYEIRLEKIKEELPDTVLKFINHLKNENKSAVSILSYTYDVKNFLEDLKEEFEIDAIIKIDEEKIASIDKSRLSRYISKLERKGLKEKAIARNLTSLRAFFQFMYSKGKISGNPVTLIKIPKYDIESHKKNYLSKDEAKKLVASVYKMETLNDRQKVIAQKSLLRDTAIVSLLTTCDIKLIELAGLDIDDVNEKNKTIRIEKKDRSTEDIKLEDETYFYLNDYINYEREAYDDSNRALFLTSKGDHNRISIRSIERMVGKYTKDVFPEKNVTTKTIFSGREIS